MGVGIQHVEKTLFHFSIIYIVFAYFVTHKKLVFYYNDKLAMWKTRVIFVALMFNKSDHY